MVVQTAFVHGRLVEELFLEIPEGYKEFMKERGHELKGDYVKLEKSLYGLVQVAQSWWTKFVTVLTKKLNFKIFLKDGCLLKRETKLGKSFLIMYVDDCLIVRDKHEVRKTIVEIKQHFNIKHSDNIEDFVGCHIERVGDKVLLSQPDLIGKLLKEYKIDINRKRKKDTPAQGNKLVIRITEDNKKLNDKKQTKFRSGVGSLLYLLKHSRPDLSNSLRELSKVMDGAT